MNDLVFDITARDNATPTLSNVRQELERTAGASGQIDRITENFNKLQNSTKPLSAKLSGIKRLMQQMVSEGKDQSPMFRRMAAAAADYQRQLNSVTEAIREQAAASSGLEGGGMFGGLDFKDFASKLGGSIGVDVGGMMGAIASPAGIATAAITAVGATLAKAGEAAADFETHLDGLQSLTGLSDEAMQSISDGTLTMSKRFRASAGDIVEAMKLIGSQAPELLADKDALMSVTAAANTLAEAAKIQLVDAAKAITGTMNQMGASASEASAIINVFAAASQQGSADVAYLNRAFEKSGTAASSAGMNYTELAALIETVGPKFSSADVAGSQLASTLLKLSIQASDEFKPAVVGMSKALENLAAAELDDAAIKGLVGESNVTMLKTLIDGRSTFDSYTESLAGTNTAYEQMATNNDNFAGSVARMKSMWEVFLITLGQSGIMRGIMDSLELVMDVVNELMDAIGNVVKAFDTGAEDTISNTWLLQTACQLLILAIHGVGEVMQVVTALIGRALASLRDGFTDAVEWVRGKWADMRRTFGDTWFIRNMIAYFENLLSCVRTVVGKIKELWNDLKEWLGLPVDTPDLTPDAGGETAPGAGGAPTAGATSTVGNSASPSGGKGAKTGNAKYEKGSLADLQAQLRAINDELTNRNIDYARAQQLAAEAEQLEKQIQLLKERNKLSHSDRPLGGRQEAEVTLNTNLDDGIADASKTMRKQMDETIAAANAMHEEARNIINSMAGDVSNAVNQWTDLAKVLQDSTIGGTEKAAAALSTLGTSLEQIGGDGAIAKAGAMLAAVGQIILGFATASAQAASLGPFGWLAFVGAGLATVATAISAIKGYNAGGIIPGSQHYGDGILARVNAGEMILTPRQQSNLFNLLDGSTAATAPGSISFVLRGSDIHGALTNFNSKRSRIK